MSQPSYFTIKEPCHENWENMSVSDKGKFCSSCQKHVHDFTNATLSEIKTVYEQNNKSVCGRISSSLLREQYVQAELRQRNFNYLKRFCLAVIICFGASLFSMSTIKANSLNRLKEKFLYVESDTVKIDSVVVKGVLKDKTTKEEIPFANVVLFQNELQIGHTSTDMDGKFSFKISKNSYNLNLKATFVGYSTIELANIKVEEKDLFLNVEMELGGYVDFIGLLIDYPPLLDPFQSGKTISREDYINGAPK